MMEPRLKDFREWYDYLNSKPIVANILAVSFTGSALIFGAFLSIGFGFLPIIDKTEIFLALILYGSLAWFAVRLTLLIASYLYTLVLARWNQPFMNRRLFGIKYGQYTIIAAIGLAVFGSQFLSPYLWDDPFAGFQYRSWSVNGFIPFSISLILLIILSSIVYIEDSIKASEEKIVAESSEDEGKRRYGTEIENEKEKEVIDAIRIAARACALVTLIMFGYIWIENLKENGPFVEMSLIENERNFAISAIFKTSDGLVISERGTRSIRFVPAHQIRYISGEAGAK